MYIYFHIHAFILDVSFNISNRTLYCNCSFLRANYTRLLHTDILLFVNCARRVDVIIGCRNLTVRLTSHSVGPDMDDNILNNIMY